MIARAQSDRLVTEGKQAAARRLLDQRGLWDNEAVNQLLEGGDAWYRQHRYVAGPSAKGDLGKCRQNQKVKN